MSYIFEPKPLSTRVLIFFNLYTYFTSVVQQPYGYNVTSQLQEPKLQLYIKPATVKVVYTILYSPEASLQWAATHLTLNHGFPVIRLSQPRRIRLDPTESLAHSLD